MFTTKNLGEVNMREKYEDGITKTLVVMNGLLS